LFYETICEGNAGLKTIPLVAHLLQNKAKYGIVPILAPNWERWLRFHTTYGISMDSTRLVHCVGVKKHQGSSNNQGARGNLKNI